MDRYDLGEAIGEGSFGDVFVAVKKSTGEKVHVCCCFCCCSCVSLVQDSGRAVRTCVIVCYRKIHTDLFTVPNVSSG